jgi:hypothetical protein
LLALTWTPPTGANRAPLPHAFGWFVQPYNGELIVWQFGVSDNASSSMIIMVPRRGRDADHARQQLRPGAAVFAVGGRHHRLAVCAVVLSIFRPMTLIGRRGARGITGRACCYAARADAEDRQLRPFIGATFGGGTTFVGARSRQGEAGDRRSAVFLGEDVRSGEWTRRRPGFFESDDNPLVSAAA